MKRIIQLSDLHFGKTDVQVVDALIRTVNEIKPDVIAISGDLTQRAKREEFAQAKQFLQNLPFPQVIVPGNHDISLYNLWRRFFKPLERYNEVATPANKQYIDSEIAVIGVNTARSLVFKGGRVNEEQIAEVGKIMAGLSQPRVEMIVSHHPLTEVASKQVLEQLMDVGVNIFLAGHRHTADSEEVAKRYKDKNHSALLIQAGTATSVRHRGETNSFNLIEVETESNTKVTIINYYWDSVANLFNPGLVKAYEFTDNAWRRLN
jgi:3',5'-cyclic AMP phosphodiesterase CpdA